MKHLVNVFLLQRINPLMCWMSVGIVMIKDDVIFQFFLHSSCTSRKQVVLDDPALTVLQSSKRIVLTFQVKWKKQRHSLDFIHHGTFEKYCFIDDIADIALMKIKAMTSYNIYIITLCFMCNKKYCTQNSNAN